MSERAAGEATSAAERVAAGAGGRPETLADLLGGSRGAIDASLPVAAFVGGWLMFGRSVPAAAASALAVTALVAGWRITRGARPRALLLGVLAVCASAIVALYTGRAEDFFLIQIFSNAASALLWTVSIVLGWPLLGIIVGTILGQQSWTPRSRRGVPRARWRRDPALLHAYSSASWVWVGQYALRLVILLPLWAGGWVAALGAVRIALTWPLVAACLGLSWWVLRRALPAGHPGLRHPQDPRDHDLRAP